MKIVLFSKSPRRQELLKLMGLDFRVVTKDVDESFPAELVPEQVAEYIAINKAKAFDDELSDETLVAADTVVAVGPEILGKPIDASDAYRMLKMLSGKTHQVYTGVAILHQHKIISFTDKTDVEIKELTDEEINFYIKNYQPYDKAGAYGIQEWFGLVAVKAIHGSYTNVMGLPTEKLYAKLRIYELANLRNAT
jgi:septum formation protein